MMNIRQTLIFLAIVTCLSTSVSLRPSSAAEPLPAIDGPHWDLSQQYPDVASWDNAREGIEQGLKNFPETRRFDISNASRLVELLDEARQLRGKAANMARFALLSAAADQSDVQKRARLDGAIALEARVEGEVSRLDRAVSALGAATLQAWQAQTPRLAPHGWTLWKDITAAGHLYPESSEAPYALLGRTAQTSSNLYDALTSADLGWPTIKDERGKAITVDAANFGDLSTRRNPRIRRSAIHTYYKKMKHLEEPFGLLLTRKIEIENNIAHARDFADSTEAFFSLASGFALNTMQNMLQVSRSNKETIGRYARMVALTNKLRHVRYSDLLVSAPKMARDIPLEEAKRITVAAFSVLGTEYQQTLKRRFAAPWFDLENHTHKDPGAIGVYWQVGDGGHPLGIQNYNNDLVSARTLSGIGALTMFYSDIPLNKLPTGREDDFPVYGNAIWNMAPLLYTDRMLLESASKTDRIAILATDLRRLYARFARYVIAADFSSRLEAAVAAGRPPTGSQISDLYRTVITDYNDESAAPSSPEDGEEWMTLVQLFYQGHVLDEFAYSVAASVGIYEGVKSGNTHVVKAIISPLHKEASYSDYDLLRDASVDPRSRVTYEAVFKRMNWDMDQLDLELR